MNREHDPRRAAHLRDRASARVRTLTTGLIAGATLLTAAFAGLAASSTHTAKRVVRTVAATRPAVQKTVTAPTPTLVPNGSTATPSTQQPQQQVQSQAVTPATAPPVVVGGGS